MYVLWIDDIININGFNPKNIKWDKKPYKNILIYYCTGCETPDDLKLLYVNLNKADGYIEDSNGNKYLTSFPADESKHKMKKYKET